MTAKVKFQIKKTFSVKLLPFPHFVYRSWYWLTLTAGDEVHKNGIGPDTSISLGASLLKNYLECCNISLNNLP